MRIAFWRSLSIAAFSQALSSGTTFLLTVYLLKSMQPEAFGKIAAATAFVIAATSIFSAWVMTPLTLQFASIEGPERSRHIGLTHAALLTMNFALAGVGTLALLFPFRPVVTLAYLCGLTCLLAQHREFWTREAFNRKQESAALAINLVYALLLAVMLAVLADSDGSQSPTGAMLAIGVAMAASASAGWLLLGSRHQPWRIPREAFRHLYATAVHGSPSGISAILYNLRTQSNMLALGLLFGASAIAVLQASRIFVAPLFLLTPVIIQVGFPRLAATFKTARPRFESVSARFTLLVTVLAVTYCVALALSYKYLEPLLIDPSYGNLSMTVLAWGLCACAMSFRSSQETLLSATGRLTSMMWANLAAVPLALVGVLMGAWLGWVSGSVIGLAFVEALLGVSFLALRRFATNTNAH